MMFAYNKIIIKVCNSVKLNNLGGIIMSRARIHSTFTYLFIRRWRNEMNLSNREIYSVWHEITLCIRILELFDEVESGE